MIKAKSWEDIKADPRIEEAHWQYDGRNKHMVLCKEGYRFDNTECRSDIGTVKELCESVNTYLQEHSPKP